VSCALETRAHILTVAEAVTSLAYLPDKAPVASPRDRRQESLLEGSRGASQE
jgi:hypothetical protein